MPANNENFLQKHKTAVDATFRLKDSVAPEDKTSSGKLQKCNPKLGGGPSDILVRINAPLGLG